MLSRPFATALATALLVPLLGAMPPALADGATRPHRVTSSIRLNDDGTRLLGDVASARRGCRALVKVTLHFHTVGTRGYQEVATDRTDRRGAWEIHAPVRRIPAGHYFVTTAATHACRASESPRTRA